MSFIFKTRAAARNFAKQAAYYKVIDQGTNTRKRWHVLVTKPK